MSQTDSPAIAQLALLQKRADALNTRRSRVQFQLETARKNYTDAVASAEKTFKTSNLAELRAELVALEAKNSQAIVDFTLALDEAEKFISVMEEALADPEKMAATILAMEQNAGVQGGSSVSAPATPAPATTAPVFVADDI